MVTVYLAHACESDLGWAYLDSFTNLSGALLTSIEVWFGVS